MTDRHGALLRQARKHAACYERGLAEASGHLSRIIARWLQEGLLLLGVAVAIPYARLSPGVAELGAWLLVVASLFQDASVGLGIVAYGVACGLAAG